MSAAGGFDVPASARDESDELRRDKPEPAEEEAPREPAAPLPDVPTLPETLKTPEPGHDDLQ